MSKPKLLIVEDDPGLCAQYRWAFPDYRVLMANDRPQAEVLLRKEQPSAVLLDLGLPPDPEGVSEGFAALEALRRIKPGLPVVVATGQGQRENALRAIALGAYDFCEKPIDLAVLRTVLARALRMRELEEENLRLAAMPRPSPIRGIITADEGMLKACRAVVMALEAWLKREPADITALGALAQLDIRAGRLLDAERRLASVLEHVPDDVAALNNLAWVANQSGGAEAARRARALAERAYILMPNANTADTLGWVLTTQGEAQMAVPLLRQAVAQARDRGMAYRLAFALTAAGAWEEATRLLEHVLGGEGAFPEQAEAERLLVSIRDHVVELERLSQDAGRRFYPDWFENLAEEWWRFDENTLKSPDMFPVRHLAELPTGH